MNWKEAIEVLYPKTTYEPYYTRNYKRYACKVVEKELETLETLKKHIKVVNGQLIFKGISPKKNKQDYQKILEVLGL